ncbi:hypothetical protein LTR08_005491 [Meristemomyces frigidus]|nr:hypothetical protein LTR08_005491 [Meristemomyces frigidus]
MRPSTPLLAALLALASHATAAIVLPACALSCYTAAIAASGCAATDIFCQCSTGQTALQSSAIPCLCKSTCSTTDLLQVVQDSNKDCSSALAASSMTYAARTVGLDTCATANAAAGSGSAAASGSATGTAAAASASATASGAGGSASAASASASVTAASGAGAVGWERAGLGLAGLVAWVL